ncbi:uncharacterized protein PV07_01828 [Cladophialophora immunda]|uniref:CsbD-like domain-containing protein n=1 Tax=Cladophialophora immunda TaxID=569365 RepID=A0A0D2A486_9EURO|nr:uncharacterized protein PV07_01828 [Cladophialophora immunda]KIW35111.1 hypothetical protein PV07_01828 [Cladophialophora immunda]
MTDRTQGKTHEAVGDVKSVLKGVKGLGDTIRGSVNESIDTAFNDREGEVKNKAVKEKGEADIQRADQRFGGTTTSGTRHAAGGTTTGAGAHSGGVGNMSSTVPQTGLGGEPTTTRERF